MPNFSQMWTFFNENRARLCSLIGKRNEALTADKMRRNILPPKDLQECKHNQAVLKDDFQQVFR